MGPFDRLTCYDVYFPLFLWSLLVSAGCTISSQSSLMRLCEMRCRNRCVRLTVFWWGLFLRLYSESIPLQWNPLKSSVKFPTGEFKFPLLSHCEQLSLKAVFTRVKYEDYFIFSWITWFQFSLKLRGFRHQLSTIYNAVLKSLPRKLNHSSHLGSYETSDSHDERGDYPFDGGWIRSTQIGGRALYPLPTTLRKVKYWEPPTRNVEVKELLGLDLKCLQDVKFPLTEMSQTQAIIWHLRGKID